MATDTELLIRVFMFLGILGAVIFVPWMIYRDRKKLPLKYQRIGCVVSAVLLLCGMYMIFQPNHSQTIQNDKYIQNAVEITSPQEDIDIDVGQTSDIAHEKTPQLTSNVEANIVVDDFPLVTYDEIQSGDYKNRIVCIEAIVDNVEHIYYQDVYSHSSFDLWYRSNDTYVCRKMHHIFSATIDKFPDNADFLKVSNGDIIRYVTLIYRDNSFGPTESRAVEIVGHVDMYAFHTDMDVNDDLKSYEEPEMSSESETAPEPVVIKANAQVIERALLAAIPQRYQSDSMFFTNVYVNDDNTVEFMIQLDQNTDNKDAALSLAVYYWGVAKQIAEDSGGEIAHYDMMVLNDGAPVGDYVTEDGITYSVIADGKVKKVQTS